MHLLVLLSAKCAHRLCLLCLYGLPSPTRTWTNDQVVQRRPPSLHGKPPPLPPHCSSAPQYLGHGRMLPRPTGGWEFHRRAILFNIFCTKLMYVICLAFVKICAVNLRNFSSPPFLYCRVFFGGTELMLPGFWHYLAQHPPLVPQACC